MHRLPVRLKDHRPLWHVLLGSTTLNCLVHWKRGSRHTSCTRGSHHKILMSHVIEDDVNPWIMPLTNRLQYSGVSCTWWRYYIMSLVEEFPCLLTIVHFCYISYKIRGDGPRSHALVEHTIQNTIRQPDMTDQDRLFVYSISVICKCH